MGYQFLHFVDDAIFLRIDIQKLKRDAGGISCSRSNKSSYASYACRFGCSVRLLGLAEQLNQSTFTQSNGAFTLEEVPCMNQNLKESQALQIDTALMDSTWT